ncbi:hypothetical protein CR513_48968, partial [Mucuna pruriens]
MKSTTTMWETYWRGLYKIISSSQPLGGPSFEKPVTHLKELLHFANTTKIIVDTIHLRLFPFLLVDKALN